MQNYGGNIGKLPINIQIYLFNFKKIIISLLVIFEYFYLFNFIMLTNYINGDFMIQI